MIKKSKSRINKDNKIKYIPNDFGVVQVASEFYPFAKTGGLAHVIRDLTFKLSKLGIEVNVLLPLFGSFPRKDMDKLERIEQDFTIKIDDVSEFTFSCDKLILETNPDCKIIFYFINHYNFFGTYSRNLYSSDEMHKHFYFFTKAVLAIMEKYNIKADIIHHHDWMTGLIPELIKNYKLKTSKKNRSPKTLFTIHNLGFQGSGKINHNRLKKHRKGLHYKTLPDYINNKAWNKINFLRHGIKYSNLISTVSNEYAQEIQTKEFGEGVDALLRSRAPIYGIVNGIDNEYNSPETSKFLFYNYNKINFEHKKRLNKIALLKKFKVKMPTKNTSLLITTHRLATQKGFDLILKSFEYLMSKDIVLFIAGEGDKRYVRKFNSLVEQYPDKFIFYNKQSEVLEHRLYAAGDFILCPSVYEPCGTGHLKAMIYGCVPIARKVGGLTDTVFDYNEKFNSGTGFLFLNYNQKEFIEVIDRSLYMHLNQSEHWNSLVRRCMSQSFSWEKQTQEYLTLYKRLLTI